MSMKMVGKKTMISASCQIYRPAEKRPKILMRADSMPAPIFPSTAAACRVLDSDTNERAFRAMADVSKCLQCIFQTKNATVCVGHCSNEIEMILTNFIDKLDTVLVGVIGEMGRNAANIVRRIEAKVDTIEAYAGRVLDYDSIEARIVMLRPNVFFIVHGENSTGALQPLDRIGELCETHNCLLIVDAVETLGAVKLSVDDWKIDVAYGSSQKGLGGSLGIVPVTYSRRALVKLKNRKTNMHTNNARLNIKMLIDAWRTYDESKFLYTDLVPVSFLYILRENLHKIMDEGLPNVIKRHRKSSRRLQTALMEIIGLDLFVEKEEHRLPTIITVKMPVGITDKLFTKYLSDRHFIEISPGVGDTSGQIIRIGLVGGNANRKTVDCVLRAFYDALKMMIPNHKNYCNNAYFYY